MTKSVTIKLDDGLLREARHLAVDESQSFTTWVAGLVQQRVEQERGYRAAAQAAIASMEDGANGDYGSGKKFDRGDLYSGRVRG